MRPAGIKLGEFSILGGVDLSALLTADQLAKVAAIAPEVVRLRHRRTPFTKHLRLLEGGAVEPTPQPTVQLPPAWQPVRHTLPVVDQLGRRDCQTCVAPCCMILAAGLTEEEARSGRWDMEVDRNGHPFLKRRYGRCVYLTPENDCSTYQDRPAVCVGYRCDTPGHEDRRIDRWLSSGGSSGRR